MYIAAGQFKSQCLKLMDQVRETHEEIIITKHGKAVAKLVPVDEEPSRPLLGFLQGTVAINGDIVQPVDEEWEADQGHA